MAAPRTSRVLTLSDMVACGLGGTIVAILSSATEFAAHDNRETVLESLSAANTSELQLGDGERAAVVGSDEQAAIRLS